LVEEPGVIEPAPLSVRSLLATSDGRLLIGYAGDGLGHFKDGRYQRITSADGLTDDFVSQLLADASGNLWLTGNRGLARISFGDLDAFFAARKQRIGTRSYGKGDGLPAMQPNRNFHPSAWRDGAGKLWFSTLSGLLMVQPDNIRDNPRPPPVQLESLTVDDRLVAVYNAGSPMQKVVATNVVNLRGLDEPLEIGPGFRKLVIDFAALSFTSPENVRFRYQLRGFDAGWIEPGPDRPSHPAVYPALPAGEYEFQALACNNSGVWNEAGASLKFVVMPFYWETWWFKLIVVLVTALLVGGVAFSLSRRRYRQQLLRVEARRALEQERSRIAKDIHDDLGATLTRISLLSQPSRAGAEDAESAVESLAQIHHTARDLTHAMGEVVWAVNPEHDSFDSLANYISHYAQNFLRVTAIRCRIEVPLQLPRRPLSAEVRHNLFLAFKEALNNVVKHSAATEVRIALTPHESGFELVVADNGRGFSHESVAAQTAGAGAARPAPGNGLANMRSRLQEIGGDCELTSQPGRGTTITFRVQLKPHHGQA
jgi:signal transduction histidine kinase